MSYTLVIKRSAQRELRALSAADRDRISAEIDALLADPRPTGCEKLRGFASLWRIRVGDFRVIYEVHDKELVVHVVRVARRNIAYRNLEGLG